MGARARQRLGRARRAADVREGRPRREQLLSVSHAGERGARRRQRGSPKCACDFNRFFALRQKLQNAYLQNRGDSLVVHRRRLGARRARRRCRRLAGRSATPRATAATWCTRSIPAPRRRTSPRCRRCRSAFVRAADSAGAPDASVPRDTLELWVDDIRLGNVVNRPGYAGQVSVALSAADIADIRVGFTQQGSALPAARRCSRASSTTAWSTSSARCISRSCCPARLGLAMPLTITHLSSASTPLYLSGTDIRGARRGRTCARRAPASRRTRSACAARRRCRNPLLGALVDNLGLTSTYTTGDSRNEYQQGNARQLRAQPRLQRRRRAAHRAAARVIRLPLGAAAQRAAAAAARHAAAPGTVFRWNPTVLRISSGVVRGTDRRFSFFKPADALDDSARESRAEPNLWRNASTLELRPTERAHRALGLRLAARPSRLRRHHRRGARRDREPREPVRRQRRRGARAVAPHLVRLRAAASRSGSGRAPTSARSTACCATRTCARRARSVRLGHVVRQHGDRQPTLPRRITVSQNHRRRRHARSRQGAHACTARDSTLARRWAKVSRRSTSR